MMDFFNSIKDWFALNQDKILLFFTSGQFVLLIAQLTAFVKTIKTSKDEINVTKTLKSAMQESKIDKDTITNTANSAKEVNETLGKVQKQLGDFIASVSDRFSSLECKAEATLKVQSIVYASIKDEKVRNSVSNILLNAKYSESQTRAELQRQIELLKTQVNEQVHQITEAVEKTTGDVTAVLTGEKSINIDSSENDEPVLTGEKSINVDASENDEPVRY